MRFRTRELIGIMGIGLILVAACSKNPSEEVVARVKDRTITLEEFESAINSVSDEYLPSTMELSGLLEFLDTMIDRELLALKADELGYDKDPKVVEGMETFRAMGLQAGYMKVKIADKMDLTEKDIQRVYKHFGLKYRVKQILTDTEAEAWEVYALLKDGHDFESVCRQYSRGPDAAQGGKVVGVVYGQFPPHFQDAVFGTKVGGITEPIINQYGYFVIKVIDKTQPPLKPLEEVRTDVQRIALMEKQLRLTFDISKDIRERHDFQYYDDNLKIVFDALPPDIPLLEAPPRSTEIYPLLDLEPQDLDKPVASYRDKVITIRDFSDLYDRAQFTMRPRREYRLGQIKKFILDVAMNDLIELELEESDVQSEPEVAKMFQRKREELMVNRLYFDLIDSQTQVPWGDIEQYYNEHREQFYSDEQRMFDIILTGDRESAEEARALVVSGQPFERVAANYARPEDIEKTGIDQRFVTKDFMPEIATYGFALRDVGDVSEPFEIPQGWAVVKLLDRQPAGYTPIQQAQHTINHNLKQLKNDEKLEQLLAKWREEVVIEVNEDVLKNAVVSRQPGRSSGAAH